MAVTCQVRPFDLAGVQGLSKKAIDLHLGLYKTYVEQLNKLLEQSPQRSAGAAPLTLDGYNRRFAYEYNGVALHELFFEQLAGKRRQPRSDSDFAEALQQEPEARRRSAGVNDLVLADIGAVTAF
jgi:Fe-Mn family superoxide dismutase